MNVERKKKDARWCNATSWKEASPSRRVNEPSSAKSAFTEEAGWEQLLCRFLFRGLWKKHQSLFSTHQEQWPLLGDIVTSTYSFILIITIFWKPVIHTKLSQNQLCMQNVSLLIFFNAFCLTFNWITPTDSGQEKGGIKNHWAIIGCCWLLANQSVWDQRVQWVCFKSHMWASSTIPDAASLLAVGTNEQNVFYWVF